MRHSFALCALPLWVLWGEAGWAEGRGRGCWIPQCSTSRVATIVLIRAFSMGNLPILHTKTASAEVYWKVCLQTTFTISARMWLLCSVEPFLGQPLAAKAVTRLRWAVAATDPNGVAAQWL